MCCVQSNGARCQGISADTSPLPMRGNRWQKPDQRGQNQRAPFTRDWAECPTVRHRALPRWGVCLCVYWWAGLVRVIHMCVWERERGKKGALALLTQSPNGKQKAEYHNKRVSRGIHNSSPVPAINNTFWRPLIWQAYGDRPTQHHFPTQYNTHGAQLHPYIFIHLHKRQYDLLSKRLLS